MTGEENKASSTILLGGEDAVELDESDEELPSSQQHMSATDEIPTKIITPSPYPHHTTGPTSARFRNALARITTDPTSDVEAWQALITEASACYRALVPNLHAVDSHPKLDWIESCYGALLHNFPYAVQYYVTLVEMLLAQSARVGEEHGPVVDLGISSQPSLAAEAKLEKIFRNILGVNVDGTAAEDDSNKLLGGMCTSSTELWLLYVRNRVREAHRQASASLGPEARADLVREWTTKAYEVAITHASFVYNNHNLWKPYLAFVKSWVTVPGENHALQQKQMVQLRSIYQRLVTHPMTGLDQLWQEYEAFEKGQSEALAVALIAEFAPKYQHARSIYLERNRIYSHQDLQMGRLATPPAEVSEDDDAESKMRDEQQLLTLWKKRTSYERTNPERLPQEDLERLIRQAYKDMVCNFTRHPEVWHMWSAWELFHTSKQDPELAVSVLQLGQTHLPDCTLLAYAEAQTLEAYGTGENSSKCIEVMERFVERAPNTLGFVLLQQLVRRYQGVEAARSVFANARRVLRTAGEEKEEKDSQPEAAAEASGAAEKEVKESAERRMVTNRLDAAVGVEKNEKTEETEDEAKDKGMDEAEENATKKKPGIITWHLYASHATIEHRLNHSPSIAARVYELGLRKHVSFLTKPPYVLRYAHLLLELQDTENLRALLTRAVSACEGAKGTETAALWDMMLRFESITSSSDSSSGGGVDVKVIQAVERRRRAALLGPDVEDVSTGGLAESGEQSGGSQKSTVSEQLIRSEGYDISSYIVNGLSRVVDVLEIMGIWGNTDNPGASQIGTETLSSSVWEDDMAGGKSDASFQRRLHFERMLEAGISTGAGRQDGLAATGPKILSARERLHQAGAGAVPSVPTGAQAVVIQQSPEWLRPMLLLLPPPRFRNALMNKPPPHMIEMTLSSLRTSVMPAERPTDDENPTMNGPSRKRKLGGGGDSSDEENGNSGGGYGNQFRARQKARQMTSAQQNGLGSLGDGAAQ